MKIVPREEFVALLKSRCSAKLREHLPRYDLSIMLGRGECAVHEGDLSLAGNWQPTVDNLLVLGSITCGGLLHAAREGSEWGGSLWIFGDLRCRHFAGHSGTSVVVDGDLAVAELAVAAFEDATLIVTGDFAARYYYGLDIWVDLGGSASMEYGDGYALPLGYTDAEAQAILPRNDFESSPVQLNLDAGEEGVELVAKLRRSEHFRPRNGP